VVVRRIHLYFLRADHGSSIVDEVAGLMAAELGWSEEEKKRRTGRYEASVRRARPGVEPD
jgi:glycerol-3-phosphate dehydrogenase